MEESTEINDTLDQQMHPNWIALTTVKFKPKIFVKSSGTEDEIPEKQKQPETIEIDGSASEAYNEILQMPSTSKSSERKTNNKVKRSRRKPKLKKQQFNRESLFKLAVADDSDNIQKLIQTSIRPDINATDAYGWTPLMMSACEGSVNAFQVLLEFGADISIADRKGNTAVSLAEKKGFQEIVDVAEQHQQQQDDAIEISDDDDVEHGTLFCSDCGIEISKSSSTSHQTSTVHLFSCKFKGNTNIKAFGIARTNRGYEMMRRTGWDGNSALGPKHNGKLYPIRTVMRTMRTGLGIKQDSAKVTHFKANDPSAIKFKAPPHAPTRKEIHENDLRDKRHEQRLRRELS